MKIKTTKFEGTPEESAKVVPFLLGKERGFRASTGLTQANEASNNDAPNNISPKATITVKNAEEAEYSELERFAAAFGCD